MCIAIPKGRLACLIVGCQLALLVATLPLQAAETSVPESGKSERQGPSVKEEPKSVVARAYYYAKRYKGKRTSSGAIYDPRKMTAAHPTLPFGTRVKVVNLANDRSVEVVVNDRCRKRSYDLIDLSRAAASELRFLNKGKTMVRVTPVEEET